MSVYGNLHKVFWLLIFVSETGYRKHVEHGMLNSLSGRLEAVGIQGEYSSQALHESEPGVKICHSVPGGRFHISED